MSGANQINNEIINKDKLPIIFILWVIPTFILLIMDYKMLSFPFSIDILHEIPSFDAYINGTKYKILANLVWTYFWVTSPFVTVFIIYFCFDTPIGKTNSIKGWPSIFLMAMSIWLCFFLQIDLYLPDAQGYGRILRFYRGSELGVIIMVSIVWVNVSTFTLMFLQWFIWVLKNIF